MATGQPNSSPKATISSGDGERVGAAGDARHPARSAAWRELILSPMMSIASGGGPMRSRPAR